LIRGRFRVVVGPSSGSVALGRPCDGKVGAVKPGDGAVLGALSVPLVVSTGGGTPISVVDTDTLVVKELEVLDGVTISGVRSDEVDVSGSVAGEVVVRTVVIGLLHSSDIWTTVNTNAVIRARPMPPAHKTTGVLRSQGWPSGSLSAPTCADPSVESAPKYGP
jgi:hypothetical protein